MIACVMALAVASLTTQLPPPQAQGISRASAESAQVEANRKRDSMIAEMRRLEASQPRKRPPGSQGPFGEYTWVFYASIASSAIMGLVAFLLRRRNSTQVVRR
jgi:hypothetical protein